MQKIINYCGEKFILSEEVAKRFKEESIIVSVLKIPQSNNYQIEINNGDNVYFGMCKKYSQEDDLIDIRIKNYEKEEKILEHLTQAYNLFTELDKQHPDELNDFAEGIHKCQYVLGMRYAREHRPDLFPMKKGDN